MGPRHHDGVALWDSAQGLNVVRDTPAKRDLVGPFVDALRKDGLKVGLYYSLPDWSHPDYDVFTRKQKRYDARADAARWQRYLDYYQGQVRDIGQNFAWKEDVVRLVPPPVPPLTDPFATSSLVDPNAPGVTTEVIGRTSAFKTSTGVELRFFMPVLNVPFRLIYAWNPQRVGVLDNNLRPAKSGVFRFAVGTTF